MENPVEEIKFLALTVAVELPIVLALLKNEPRQRVILGVLGVNMVSHPAVWWFLFFHGGNWFVAEGCVMLFEGAVLAALFPKHRALAALAGIFANILTAAVGYFAF